jgi:hypothetical protein
MSRKKKKTYEAEFYLQCLLSNQASVGGMARLLDAFGVMLCEYHEAGIRLKDSEMLAEGVFSFVTDDPEAAELLEVCQGSPHLRKSGGDQDAC